MAEQNSGRRIGYELGTIHNLMRRKRPAEAEEVSRLTRMQNWLIGYIRANHGKDIFQCDLEREFKMTGATATNMLKRMERDGLITRQPVPHDGRRKKIVLTEKAETICTNVEAHIAEGERLMKRNITDEELDVFFRVIDKIKENLQTD